MRLSYAFPPRTGWERANLDNSPYPRTVNNSMQDGNVFGDAQAVAREEQFGDDTVSGVTLVPQNGNGNVPGNITVVDGLTKTGVDSNGFPTYTIDEDKLSNFTSLSTGQNAALKEVVEGSGTFEVRSKIDSLGLEPGDTIHVTIYKVNRQEPLLNPNYALEIR